MSAAKRAIWAPNLNSPSVNVKLVLPLRSIIASEKEKPASVNRGSAVRLHFESETNDKVGGSRELVPTAADPLELN